MRRLTHAFSMMSLAATFGAVLTGCPVWDDDGSDRVRPDAGIPVDNGPPPVTTCTSHANCPGGYCLNNRCAAAQTCGAGSPCPSGFACDARGLCIPGCSTNADCTAVAAGLVCDTTTRQCVPGGRCTTDAQCASTPATPVCLGGSCQARTNQCQFDYQCTGTGQACVDGRCVVGCTSAAQCAAGQQCTAGRCAYPTTGSCATPCATGQLCVSGVCLRTCANDATCGTGFMCDNGVCRVDTRPRPFCTMDSQCNMGSVCYNGACRRQCPNPAVTPDGDCMRVDVQFNLCRADGMGRSLCTSTNEVMPQCARSANCAAGRACVNARCQ